MNRVRNRSKSITEPETPARGGHLHGWRLVYWDGTRGGVRQASERLEQKEVESTEITLKTLTPLWTGGVDCRSDRLHETGIIGSLR